MTRECRFSWLRSPLLKNVRHSHLVSQKSHRRIAVTTVAASGLATIPLQKSGLFCIAGRKKKIAIASDSWGYPQNCGSSQRPWPQVAAAARFRSRSDILASREMFLLPIHSVLSPELMWTFSRQSRRRASKKSVARPPSTWYGCPSGTTPVLGIARGLLQKRPCQKLATHVQLLVNLLPAACCTPFLVVENSSKSPGQDFVRRVAQKLVNSWSIHRQHPIPWEVQGFSLQ